ncbi:hypothetical protein JWG45_17440 [Leptospira sp. 201903070]|uniref:Uncharacterized protein n=1 Tax=Leptospira ainlahdjerensis TaxID=2810033 RepID=A0ABS2UEY1_9LEPT|nr:hypothetical protein [Leptospira ainlahdjerensis]MBM9578932.1 hypothetical protein [Leptospira ainlahdjerensis]
METLPIAVNAGGTIAVLILDLGLIVPAVRLAIQRAVLSDFAGLVGQFFHRVVRVHAVSTHATLVILLIGSLVTKFISMNSLLGLWYLNIPFTEDSGVSQLWLKRKMMIFQKKEWEPVLRVPYC